MTTRPTPGTFCWFECGSTDAAAAKTFYTELFDWSAMDVPMPGDVGGSYTLLKAGDKDIAGLYPLVGPHFEGVPSHWATYVAVESTDDSNARALSLGATSVLPPMDVPGVGRIAMVTDPTGANIAMFQAGEHCGSSEDGPFGWSELATRDTKAAGVFYSELFGWTLKTDDGPMQYTEFQVEGRSIGGMLAMTEQHGDAPAHWMPYVMVGDCNATAAKAGELGATTYVPPNDIPNVGRFAVFADPTGATLAMIQLDGKHC
ncbi:MAG: putative enzyme related to lactoylglutathione lyase [Chlamydiales bacterium]|jgi:predicted enzyme related to lactoylglutathione lyase